MVGRKPTPTALKLAANNPGKRRLNDAEPKFPAFDSVPPCPERLTGEARAHWEEQAPLHHAAGTLARAFIPSFTILCRLWAKVCEAEDARALRLAAEIYRAYATDMGANPAASTRIKANPPDAHRDPVRDFQSRRPARPA